MADNDSKTEESANGKVKELTSAQRKGIAHLMAARSIEEAAKASGISVRTLHRWLADERFRPQRRPASRHIARRRTNSVS